MWLKRSIFATLLLVPSLALAADDFDITMDVVGSDESFDEAVVNQIELPFGRRDSDGRLQPASLRDSRLERLEELVGERITGGGGSGSAESPGSGLDNLDAINSGDLLVPRDR